MTTSEPAQTIQAEMHEGTISGLGELLQLPTERALDEVLDNARRSGATRIRITTDKRTVTVEDNGRGIADPQLLLSFGRSGWTPESEGIGFSALAAHEPEVRSRTEDGAGWRVSLRNEHFVGSTPAPIEATDEAPAPNGTAVTLTYPDTGSRDQEIGRAIANLPGLVTINGQMAENRDHLASCIYIQQEDGVRIGVEHFNHLFHGRGTVNFHGQVASEGQMPRVHCDGQTWMTRADVVDNPSLRRKLPARNVIEKNGSWRRLVQNAQKVLYTAMAREDGIEVDYQTRKNAAQLGVELPQPPSRLEEWQPAVADSSGFFESKPKGRMVELTGNEIIVESSLEPGDEQVIARALKQSSGEKLQLVRANKEREEYGWYDILRRLTGYGGTLVTDNGEKPADVHTAGKSRRRREERHRRRDWDVPGHTRPDPRLRRPADDAHAGGDRRGDDEPAGVQRPRLPGNQASGRQPDAGVNARGADGSGVLPNAGRRRRRARRGSRTVRSRGGQRRAETARRPREGAQWHDPAHHRAGDPPAHGEAPRRRGSRGRRKRPGDDGHKAPAGRRARRRCREGVESNPPG